MKERKIPRAPLLYAGNDESGSWRVIGIDSLLILAVFTGYIMTVHPSENYGLQFFNTAAQLVSANTVGINQSSQKSEQAVGHLPVSGMPEDEVIGLKITLQDWMVSRRQRDAMLQITGANTLVITGRRSSFFPLESTSIPSEMAKLLNMVAIALHQHGEVTANIVIHSDAIAPIRRFNSNAELGRAQAQAVEAHLLNQGEWLGRRFTVSSAGASEPLAANSTEAGRDYNRRIEISFAVDQGAESTIAHSTGSNWRSALTSNKSEHSSARSTIVRPDDWRQALREGAQ